MNKIQKNLEFTCPVCHSIYQLLEIHNLDYRSKICGKQCLTDWKQLLHQHFQEQIILHLAQEEAKKDHDSK